jgi:hypothetical protein
MEDPGLKSDRRLELTLELTADDVFRANVALAWRSLVKTIGILGLAVIAVLVLDRNTQSPSGAPSPLTAVVIAVAVFFAPAYIGLLYWRSRRAFRNSRVYRSGLSYVFTEKGISAKGPTFSAESDWSNVAGVRETQSLFILLPPTSAMTILPKRCFADAAALEALRELVRAHVSGKVKLWS